MIMSENKRFKIYIDYDDWSIIDTTGEYVAEDYIEWMSQKQVCDLLNEQDEQIKELKKENKGLKQQNKQAIDLILDGIMEMHDGKRDYAETLFNKAIKMININGDD